MPKKNGDYGDLYVEIVVIYPDSLTNDQLKGNNKNKTFYYCINFCLMIFITIISIKYYFINICMFF